MSKLPEIAIGSLAKGIRGVSYKPHQLREDIGNDDFYLFRSNNIQDGKIYMNDLRIVDKICVSNKQKLTKGDIIVCMSNGSRSLVGKSALIKNLNGNYCVGSFCSTFRAIKGVNHEFVYQVFRSDMFKNSIDIILSGSAINNLQNNHIEELKFILPNSTVDQDNIAKILGKADETIEQTEQLILKYQRIKTGLMQDLLTKGIDENGNIRSKETHKFEVKNGIEVPIEWEVSPTIKELYMKGRIGWQGLKASEFSEEGNYLVTGVHFTKNNKVDWDICYRISDERYNEAPEIQLKNNDVLITKDGTIGKVAFIDSLPGKASLNSHLLVLRPLKENILPKFIYYTLMDSRFKYFIESIKSGSTLVGLSQTNFGKYNLLIPDPIEQKRIITVLDHLNTTIENEVSYLSKLTSLKTGLMQDLLSGKVRVKY